MVISQLPEIILQHINVLTNAASIALNASRDTLCSMHAITTSGNHRNGAIGRIFTRIRSTEGSSADCSLFILSLHALGFIQRLILLQIFLYEDLSTLALLHLSVVFPSRMPAGPRTLLRKPILL